LNPKLPPKSRKAETVNAIFSSIAGRYDLLNRLMTFGQDQIWRREVVRMAALADRGRLLDIGAGTGGIAIAARRQKPGLTIVATDFALPMMRVGRTRPGARNIAWCASDALTLPFADESFDAVVSGYLLRNVTHHHQAFREQMRVVKPGGFVVCLETSPPPDNYLHTLILVYMKVVIPFIGRWISGSKNAYTYLTESTRLFMKPSEMTALMTNAGLVDVTYRRYMLGTIAIHRGKRP
jgi:demethylmenaquinone methyltransferase / 2-methoxy-6-polyprenyl-1,4-benzoquinol methylase